MLNRRHIRIKVLQVLYAFHQSEENDSKKGLEVLMYSIEKMYDLYILLLQSLPELLRMAEFKLEDRKNKLLPSNEDLNPNLKFVNNTLIKSISKNKELNKISNNRKINWLGAEKQEIFRKMFLNILDSETYFVFMNNGVTSEIDDKEFAIQIFKSEVINSIFLHNYLEDSNIFWQDDLDLCSSMVIKSLKTYSIGKEIEILPIFKPHDNEKDFLSNLFLNVISKDDELSQLINDYTENWELDRIAKMDILLIKLAITEAMIFSEIPTKVTLNEYIEISKYYSTPKSNQFINGVLDKIINALRNSNKIKKTGRGLLNS